MKTLCLHMTILACFTIPGFAQVDLSGEWLGYYEVEAHGVYPEIEVHLAQDGGVHHYSGTYATSNGFSGTVTLDVSTNDVVIGMADPSPGCPGEFSGSGIYDDGLLRFVGSGTDCTGTYYNQELVICRLEQYLDKQRWIQISQRKRPGGQLHGSVWCHVEDSTGLISGTFHSPNSDQYKMELISGGEELDFSLGVAHSDLDRLFPNGIYYFKVKRQDGPQDQTWYVFTCVTTGYPDVWPSFHVQDGALFDVNTSFSIGWDAWLNPPSNWGGWFADSKGLKSHSIKFPSEITSVSYSDIDFTSEESVRLHVSFDLHSPEYATRTNTIDLRVFIGNPLLEHMLILGKNRDPFGRQDMVFMVSVDSPQLELLHVRTPNDEILDLVDTGGESQVLLSEEGNGFLARFPDGNYELNGTSIEDSTHQTVSELGGEFPSDYPIFVTPANGSSFDLTLPFQEVELVPVNAYGMVFLYEREEMPVSSTPLHNDPVFWEANLDPNQDTFQIPSSILDPRKVFEVAVVYFGGLSPTASKITRSHIYVRGSMFWSQWPAFIMHWNAVDCEPFGGVSCDETDLIPDDMHNVLDLISYVQATN